MEFQRVTHDGGLALVRTRKTFPVLWPLGQQKAKRITFLNMSHHLEFCVFTHSHGVGKEAELILDLIPPTSFILITSWGRALSKLQLAQQFSQVHSDSHGAKMQLHVSCH